MGEPISNLLESLKAEWDLDLYNPEAHVQYVAYPENLGAVVSRFLGKQVNLQEERELKRLRMAVTHLH